MNKEVIKCAGLIKTFNSGQPNEFTALKGLDISIKEGEFISIIGTSGSGKSTLLNMISCLDTPTEGEVYIEGTPLSKLNGNQRAHLRNQKLGFIFQQFNLLTSMTTFENVEITMRFAGMPKKERHEKVEELLKSVGLETKGKNRPSELSGGEQQRVAIARALANNPKIILGDEPTGNLDSKTGLEVMKMLRDLNEKHGKTLIIVTHDQNIAKQAPRTISLRDGKIICDDYNKCFDEEKR